MARPTVQSFLSRFVRPLVAGGEIHVGRPLTVEDVDAFDHELPHASVESEAVDDARAAVLAPLVCRVPPLLLERDDLALAAALHNTLFLVHPQADGVTITDKMRRRIIDMTQALATQPLTRRRPRVLGRHALLHNVFDLARTDLQLSWWTGRARFLGQQPPARLLRWKGVRRVREEVSRAGYDELLGASDVAPVMAMLLRRTPLTQVLSTHVAAPALHWEDAVFLLRDAELARLVAYHAVAPAAAAGAGALGGDGKELVATPARLAAAFEQMIERNPPAADVRAVAAFLVHLGALLVLGERGMREVGARSPLLSSVLAPERAGQRPRGLSTFFALPNALAVVEPRLAAPPGLLDDPVLARRWQVHRTQAAEAVGDAVIETLAQRLARHLGGQPVDPVAAVSLPAP
jgi:hypothetical protein